MLDEAHHGGDGGDSTPEHIYLRIDIEPWAWAEMPEDVECPRLIAY